MTLASDRYIVFTIAGYTVALPISQVLRVIRNHSVPVQATHSTHTEDLHSMGLIQVGKRMIRVMNLDQFFTPTEAALTASTSSFASDKSGPQTTHQRFFVITKNRQNELCGIPTPAPPNLMNFSPDLVQPLPPSDQNAPTHQLVRHFVTLADVDTDSLATIFLLDL